MATDTRVARCCGTGTVVLSMLRAALTSLSFCVFPLLAGCGPASSDAGTARGGAGGSVSGSAGAVAGAGASRVGAGAGGTSAGAGGTVAAGAGGVSSAGASGSAGSAGSVSSLAFSDDFEGVAAGMPPDPSKWSATVLSDCVSNAPRPMIDASQHHSGTQSLKVAGTASFCDYAMVGNTAAFKALGNVIYGRYYVRFETALPDGHTAFMIFPDATSGHALRMGGQNSALQWNRQSDDATLPSQSPAGIALSKVPPVALWTCLEFMIDQTQGLISTWVDGTLVQGLVADATPTADVDMAWGNAYKPALTGVNIGWQNYGAGPMNLWFDDFALSSTRINCQ
ncbi:MAG: hydrolase [Polyangiaceae bacterium]